MGSKGRRALGGGRVIFKREPLQKGSLLNGSLPLSFHKESGVNFSLLSVRTERSKESFKGELTHQFPLEYPPPMRQGVGDPFGNPCSSCIQWESLPNSDIIKLNGGRLHGIIYPFNIAAVITSKL